MKKEINNTTLEDLRNLFRLMNVKQWKNGIIRDIKYLFEHKEQQKNYSKSIRVANFWSNNYIEYKSNGDRNKTLSVKEYHNN